MRKRKKEIPMPRAQVWSLDILIAAVIFVLVFVIVIFVTNERTDDSSDRANIESHIVSTRLTDEDNPLGIIDEDSNAINETRLQQLKEVEYRELKDQFGIVDDFCIVITDEEGNLILIGNNSDEQVGIGKEDLRFNISGVRYNCSQKFS